MISARWLQRRKEHWTRLEFLLAQVNQHGINALNRTELREFGLLYRQAAADLSAVREDPASQQFARYLNELLGRAHNIIYAGRKSSPAGVVAFYRRDYPAIFRRLLPFTATAAVIFVASATLGTILTVMYPEFLREMLGPRMIETIERREMWTHSVVSMRPLASSAIMTNNLSVSFVAFASGMVAGLGTLYLLVFNGLLLGVIGAACWMSGMSLQLWSFVAPHGVLELPAIIIASAAGLRLAHALLFPGVLSRRDSLTVGGAEAVRLLLGAIPLLIVAGVVEGFFSPTDAPASFKFTMAFALGVLLIAYLLGLPRPATAGSVPSPPGTDSAA